MPPHFLTLSLSHFLFSRMDIAALRRNYTLESLTENDVAPDPMDQFDRWFREAMNSQLLEPNAMTLATAGRDGKPGARIVLLKGFDERGFVFYTNYESRKAQEMLENPYAALLFSWLELERQVRIEGKVERVSPGESLAYFQSRPKDSQIGAWASPQSRIITDRGALEQQVRAIAAQYADADVLPLPPFWGGYRVLPELMEFWQGRENRLHDRIQYMREGAGWKIERLAP